jgi:hypothetical protein
MFSKRRIDQKFTNEPPSKRLVQHMQNLALENKVSYQEAAELLQEAQEAGMTSKIPLPRPNSNAARDLRSSAFKRSKWPPLYWANVSVWDDNLQQKVTAALPFLLPHEIIQSFAKHADNACKLFEQDNLDYEGRKHVQHVRDTCGMKNFCCVGLWGDGVPVNWDRSESAECYSINFPGMLGKSELMRVPVTAILKRYVFAKDTMDDILKVIAWSFQICFLGRYPTTRHDGTDWLPSDRKRSKQGGQPLFCRSLLMEVRGDWAFFKSVFSFPGWNETAGCCWRCAAKPADVALPASDALWRTQRYSHWDLIRVLREKGHVSSLFRCPGLRAECFRIDWLHCCDLGVAADFLGNLFVEILSAMHGGGGADDKCKVLFLHLKEWYKTNNISDRLQKLKVSMFKRDGNKTPKLRAKAAEARALVPYSVIAAAKWLDDDNAVHQAIAQAAKHLCSCYDNLEAETFDPEHLRNSSRQFCLQYKALQTFHEGTNKWRLKPKFHLFQELCEMSKACPSATWTYRDEDFGGTVATYVRRRGGPVSAHTAARSLLHRFLSAHPRLQLLV